MKRHKHNVNIKKQQIGPAPLDVTHNEEGKVIGVRKTDHMIGNALYHPTRGWRKVRKPVGHMWLVSSLLMPYEVAPITLY